MPEIRFTVVPKDNASQLALCDTAQLHRGGIHSGFEQKLSHWSSLHFYAEFLQFFLGSVDVYLLHPHIFI